MFADDIANVTDTVGLVKFGLINSDFSAAKAM